MRSAFVVARQVVSEASRRRLLLALVVLTLLVITLTVWGVSRVDELRNAGQPLSDAQKKTIVSQLLILVMFMFSWVLSLAALFVAYGLAAGIVEIVAVQVVSGYQPPHPFEFLGFVLGEGIVILTFALMLSTRVAGMVGGVIAAILFGIAWMGGIVGGVGAAFNNATITHVGTATKLILPTDGLWRGAVWSLEPS